jgi:tetratricopeptide (TPR) repeat protein
MQRAAPPRPLVSRPIWCSLLLLGAALGLAPRPAWADLKSGQAALQAGDWERAAIELKAVPAAEKPTAATVLAELYLLTGRYPEAIAAARAASQNAARKSEGLRLLGQAYFETGKRSEAKQSFSAALQADPKNSRARLDLARFQLASGQRPAAEQTLQWFVDEVSSGAFENAGAPPLTDAGAAARCLRLWQDANDLLRQATVKDKSYLRAQLEWGDLFLEKSQPTDAQKSFEAVLKINPRQPLALLGMARLQLVGKYNVPAANQFADRALAQNPRLVGAILVKAGLCLDNEEYARGEALLKQALEVDPTHLEAQAMLAASRYLQDDAAGYERLRAAVLKLNPQYGDFYVIVSDYGVKQHRYQEAVDLNTRALALEPDNERALVALGAGYLRLGDAHEEKGLAQLRKAWSRDPFDVMNFNLLALFEEVIPKEYESFTAAPFHFRMNKKEKPVLALYVPSLMQRAWTVFCEKYGFTPKTPITVELFTQRQHYSVRTTGLPDLGAQGTCFGQLITAMSPASGEANWEQVLWHELSHVFAIQLSNNRVPRWFTEGLSEYETNVARPEWHREHNRELFLSLQRGDLWSIGDLSAAFTRPDRPNGVVIAYHQSSLVIHFLVETCGFDKILDALRLYGQGKRDDTVLPAITGKSLSEVDTDFRRWLEKRLAPYAKGYFVDWQRYADLERWKVEAAAKASDAGVQASYAAALYVAEDLDAAKAQAAKALMLDAAEPLALSVQGQVAMKKEDFTAARTSFDALLAAGRDSYAARLALGQIAAAAGDVEAAMKHLDTAKALDPDRSEPYLLLSQLYREKDRRADAVREMQGYTMLEEHEHDPARLLFDRLVAMKETVGILELAPRLIAIQPMEYYVHEHYARALAAGDRHQDAIREFEAALGCAPRKPGPIRASQAHSYLALGQKEQARAAAEAALNQDPGNEEATAVLKELGG